MFVGEVPAGSGDAEKHMNVEWRTHIGRKKKVNEDSVLIDRESGLFLLADGMSAPRAGRVASRLAVRRAHAFLKERLPLTHNDVVMPLLNQAVEHAHDAVQKASLKRRALRGMGTTLIVLCIRGETAYLSHVGDSRAYLHRGNSLQQITTDHSLDLHADRDVMMRELFYFYHARVLSQAIGLSKKVVCDGHRVELRQGDIILLCSDGLTDMLSDNAVHQIIATHLPDIDRTADVLIEAANEMGGKDNISVVLTMW
jgi:protein phosphatase